MASAENLDYSRLRNASDSIGWPSQPQLAEFRTGGRTTIAAVAMDRLALLQEATPSIVRAAGRLARFCDWTEHNEASDRADVIDAGRELREVSLHLSAGMGLDPIASYASRLSRVESRYPLAHAGGQESTLAVGGAATWRELQQAQARHDARYHADVVGMSKREQLRHYTLHVAKLAWLTQEAATDDVLMEEYVRNRLPDLLLFGIKLATVVGILLPDEPVRSEPRAGT